MNRRVGLNRIAHPSAMRKFCVLVVLAVVGGLILEVAIRPSKIESRKMASSFCSKVKAGLPVGDALALAHEDETKKMVHVDIDEMVVSFSGGCHCPIRFKGGKAYPNEVLGTS